MQVHRHITRTHTGSQTCHKDGHIADSHRDLALSKMMIHQSGYIRNLRDKVTKGNTEAAQSKQKVANLIGWPHTAVMQQNMRKLAKHCTCSTNTIIPELKYGCQLYCTGRTRILCPWTTQFNGPCCGLWWTKWHYDSECFSIPISIIQLMLHTIHSRINHAT